MERPRCTWNLWRETSGSHAFDSGEVWRAFVVEVVEDAEAPERGVGGYHLFR